MASKDTLPIDFAPAKEGQASKNIAWRTPLVGRSVSGPIVVATKFSRQVVREWKDVGCTSTL